MVALSTLIRSAAEELPAIDDSSFGAKFDRFGKARIVLIGKKRNQGSCSHRIGGRNANLLYPLHSVRRREPRHIRILPRACSNNKAID
ncbi:hypothetical protein V1520DRAFT_347964 [Lipomyces starkeyi]